MFIFDNYISGLLKLKHGKNLTHWGGGKMVAISQMTFSNAFSWMKMFKFWLNFTEVCSQGSNWQYSKIGSDNGLAPNKRQAIIWTNDALGCRRINASLGLNELRILTPHPVQETISIQSSHLHIPRVSVAEERLSYSHSSSTIKTSILIILYKIFIFNGN